MTFLARASAGLILWGSGFTLLYALHGLGCANAWNTVAFAGGTLFRWIMVGTWLLACTAATVIIRWATSLPAGFDRKLSLTSALVGLAGLLVTGAPVVLTSACI